jgi:cofilin
MKIKKESKYVVYHIEDKKVIKVEKEGKSEDLKDKSDAEIFTEMCESFPADEARYAVYDCPIIAKSGAATNKLIFIMWNSDQAPVKSKMLYASSKDAIRKKLSGLEIEYQATDKDELVLKEVAKKAGSCE